MKAFRLLLIIALLAGAFSPARAQRTAWVEPLTGGINTFGGKSIARDQAGNVYEMGTFTGRLSAQGQSVTAGPHPPYAGDVFVAKYSPAGTLLWLRTGGSPRYDYVEALAVDPAGGVYLAGANDSAFVMGPYTVATKGHFLARFDADGTVRWVQQVAETLNGIGAGGITALTVAPGGGCYAGCTTSGITTFAGMALWSTTATVFVGKWDESGTFSLVSQLGGGGTIADINLPAQGGMTLTGVFNNTAGISFPNTPGAPIYLQAPATVSNLSTFVAHLNAVGNAQWAIPVLCPDYTAGNSTVTDSQGNTFATGSAQGPLTVATLPPSLDSSGFLLKISPAGQPLWLKRFSGDPQPPGFGPFFSQLGRVLIDAQDNLYFTISFAGNRIRIPPFTVENHGTTQAVIVSCTAQGDARWVKTNDSQLGYNYDGGLVLGDRGSLFFMGSTDYQLSFDGITTQDRFNGVMTMHLVRLDPGCPVSGFIFLDANNDGVQNANEGLFQGTAAVVETVQRRVSNYATGIYKIYTDTGAYRVTMPYLPRYYHLSAPLSGAYTGRFSDYGQEAPDRPFGIAPDFNVRDVRLTLTPYTPARPGFITRYRATIENVGTTVFSFPDSLLTVHLDTVLQYISSSGTATVRGQRLQWRLPAAIQPFGRFSFDMQASLPVNVPLGTVLTSSADLFATGDVVPRDNRDTLRQTVTGSYDPNDIEVNHIRLSPAQVSAGEPLDYTIRFQNLGTDTAFTVLIRDSLPLSKLQINTVQLIAQSHNCNWSLNGEGLLTVRFPRINLPHTSVDLLRSQGFVRFRITPQPTVTAGEVIPNTAHIYFDFNAPVSTNEATTLVQQPTGLAHERPAGTGLTLYPNPATTAVTLQAEATTAGLAEVLIINALGQTVRRETRAVSAGSTQLRLPLTDLAAGVYTLRLHLPGAAPVRQRLLVSRP